MTTTSPDGYCTCNGPYDCNRSCGIAAHRARTYPAPPAPIAPDDQP